MLHINLFNMMLFPIDKGAYFTLYANPKPLLIKREQAHYETVFVLVSNTASKQFAHANEVLEYEAYTDLLSGELFTIVPLRQAFQGVLGFEVTMNVQPIAGDVQVETLNVSSLKKKFSFTGKYLSYIKHDAGALYIASDAFDYAEISMENILTPLVYRLTGLLVSMD